MTPAPFTAVARAVKTHGVAGELSCTPLEGPLDVLPTGLEIWFVPPPGAPFSARLESVRPGPKGDLVKLAGVESVEQARELTSKLMLACTEELPEGWLEPEGLDPVGLLVTDETRGMLGTVADVIVTGANDVWVVQGERYGEVLVPAIDDVVVSVDVTDRTARVRLLPGLIEGE
jgi:16S rRNA processing protein RimM